jgi:hypothetical protein
MPGTPIVIAGCFARYLSAALLMVASKSGASIISLNGNIEQKEAPSFGITKFAIIHPINLSAIARPNNRISQFLNAQNNLNHPIMDSRRLGHSLT